MNSSKTLHDPVQLGELKLQNRFVVAPLTRQRADKDSFIPNNVMTEYYTQRASFGLIITECSQVSELSNVFYWSGGIYSKEQALGWKKIVDSVHEKGGLIMLQIWHCGRSANISQLGGKSPVAPSPIAINYKSRATGEDYPVPHELTIEEIKQVVQQFKQGAIYAKEAGFDGIELHGANGYLVDQFLRDGSNKRTDIYGGSAENRSRFCLEVLDALAEVFGYGRTALRISPTGRFNDMYDSDPIGLLSYLLPELDKRNLAFVEFKRHGALENRAVIYPDRKTPQKQMPDFFRIIRKLYKGNFIANDNLSIEEAQELVQEEVAQACSFGYKSINNPDLPLRVKNGWKLNENLDRDTLFTQGPKGYTDYPFYNQE
ncbi:hypothetical protein ABPG72_015602 [Tetrahymena utriculariae]